MQAPQLLGPNVVLIPAPPPRKHLTEIFGSELDRWGAGKRYGHDPKKVPGHEKVRASIAACDAALAKLGKRTGERADAAREYLMQSRDNCAAALAAFESIGEDFDGPIALALVEEVTAHRAAENAAQAAINAASRDTIKTARDAVDLVEVDGRDLGRRISKILASVKFPALVDTAALERARSETDEITTGGNAKHKPATTLGRAIEQGASGPKGVALLWIAFEPAGASEPCDWRWRRYLENR